VPHCAALGATQLLPLQQPAGQLAALQPVHAWLVQLPPPHEAQAAPPVPHSLAWSPLLHTPCASQQPFGQLVASQTHAPETQRWPVAQAAPAPQAHAPFEQRSARASHAPHAAPPPPQLAVLCAPGATQVFPLQHPEGHELALQTQVPPEQVCPAAHAVPAPQRHVPLVQVFVPPEHGAQAAPPVPHAAALCPPPLRHMPALQHPFGQLVASHTHAPPTHRWPAAHAAPAPQRQAPPAQRSAVTPHAAHACPELPHCAAVVALTHVPPLQQPFGQLAASHSQTPETQAWPAAHAGPAPQRQEPPAQLSAEAPHVLHAAPPVPQ
jgi:hypothetical protein